MKHIIFEASAVKETLETLKMDGYSWNNLKYVNHGRYCIVLGEPIIAILLKKEPFYDFGRRYDGKGAGDSINCESLKEFVREKVEFIIIKFSDGRTYWCGLSDFLINSHTWMQKEGTKVRSISLKHYKPLNLRDLLRSNNALEKV